MTISECIHTAFMAMLDQMVVGSEIFDHVKKDLACPDRLFAIT